MQELKAPPKRISGRYVRHLERMVWAFGFTSIVLAVALGVVCCSALYFFR